ncbi:hypothetical protein [Flavobacterium pallidum]|uniref:Uncharacterized protein n=1 Tax=Flavobacterium pallidum TaxID=2172098 RepID=A0A2S1SKG0_9FLAO|nr:hypothetical protein [Flavobacterium pallidum]AWI26827.1 hypothetical protein HYN49_13480 [Flavobacterium pallidum]
MTYNWNDIKWIFEPDGALRDIYVTNINVDDWKNLIDFLNNEFVIRFGITQHNFQLNKIDKNYALQYLTSRTDQMESKTISIILDDILINCHLFSNSEIEFDIDPTEIKSETELNKIIAFMKSISKQLRKQIFLTGENDQEFPLITIDETSNVAHFLTKAEAVKKWKS